MIEWCNCCGSAGARAGTCTRCEDNEENVQRSFADVYPESSLVLPDDYHFRDRTSSIARPHQICFSFFRVLLLNSELMVNVEQFGKSTACTDHYSRVV